MPVPSLRFFELEEVHDANRLNGTFYTSRDLTTKKVPSRVIDARYLLAKVVFTGFFVVSERVASLCLKTSVKVLRIGP